MTDQLQLQQLKDHSLGQLLRLLWYLKGCRRLLLSNDHGLVRHLQLQQGRLVLGNVTCRRFCFLMRHFAIGFHSWAGEKGARLAVSNANSYENEQLKLYNSNSSIHLLHIYISNGVILSK